MKSLLNWLAQLTIKRPIKLMMISLLVILVFTVGVKDMKLATGNSTLVEPTTKAYKDNLALERNFGGESIIVLYEGKQQKNLLTPKTIQQMKGLEEQLTAYHGIYSIISPNTIIQEISTKQSVNYLDGLKEISAGLNKMGQSLNGISEKLTTHQSQLGQQQPNFTDNLKLLNQSFEKLIKGQTALANGTSQLINGYSQMGQQLKGLTITMKQINYQLMQSPESSPQQKQEAEHLDVMITKINSLSNKMVTTSKKSASLPKASQNTSKALTTMQQKLNQQMASLTQMNQKLSSQKSDLKQLGNGLAKMANQLIEISQNMNKMLSYTDTMSPDLPKKQKTLDHMVYNSDGKLRDQFNNVIKNNKDMLFIVKLNSRADSQMKTNIIDLIRTYQIDHSLKDISTTVSGKPVLDLSIQSSMKQSMQKMLALSIVFMIIVLSLIFKVRWRLLPLVIILLAVVATIGLMGWLNIPLTMVSMAVFPILIGLGIDYAIQFQNRYTEEMQKEGEE